MNTTITVTVAIIMVVASYILFEVWATKQSHTYSQRMLVNKHIKNTVASYTLTCVSNENTYLNIVPHNELGEYLNNNLGKVVEVQIIKHAPYSLITGGYIWYKIDNVRFLAHQVSHGGLIICKDSINNA